MTKQEKNEVIGLLKEKFSQYNNFYITDTESLTVAQVSQLRRACFSKNVEMKVAKNTLIRKALEKQGGNYESLYKVLHGFSGVIFSKESGNAPAKAIQEYRKKNEGKPAFKAASIQTDIFVGEESLKMLGDLKSKNEIIGEIISMLQSPAQNVLSALLSSKQTVAGLVKTLEERAK
ncbi:MAG TPA: 50S ribosomal protein L10 [Cytophagales bacterium]|nr:50S ribosomal protein L10 [Cytophagales bacterium]